MNKRVWVAVGVVLLGGAAVAQSGQWLNDSDPLVKEIYTKEKMWAEGNCSEQPGLKDVIAEKGYKAGKIIQSPIEGLIEYHQARL